MSKAREAHREIYRSEIGECRDPIKVYKELETQMSMIIDEYDQEIKELVD